MSNLSAGVQILVDQLKENPEAFFGPLVADRGSPLNIETPKFNSWRAIIEDELVGIDYHNEKLKRRLPYTWFMSEEEKEALADAYLLAKRQRFDAEIITTLTAEPEQESTLVYKTANRYTSNLASAMVQTKEAVSSGVLVSAFGNAPVKMEGGRV